MSKDQLLQFIVSKGEEQKRQLFEFAQRLTQEVEQSELPALVESLRKDLASKQAKLQ